MPIEGAPLLEETAPQFVGRSFPTNVAREIAVPFSFDRNGRVNTVTDPDVQARQHVNALLRTIPGERVMKPTYGVSLLPWVFENITPADLSAMQQRISDGFDAWIPTVRLVQLNAVSGGMGTPGDTVVVSLAYTRRFDANPVVTQADIPVVTV